MRKKREKRMERGRRNEEKMKREKKSESRVGCHMFASIHYLVFSILFLINVCVFILFGSLFF